MTDPSQRRIFLRGAAQIALTSALAPTAALAVQPAAATAAARDAKAAGRRTSPIPIAAATGA